MPLLASTERRPLECAQGTLLSFSLYGGGQHPATSPLHTTPTETAGHAPVGQTPTRCRDTSPVSTYTDPHGVLLSSQKGPPSPHCRPNRARKPPAGAHFRPNSALKPPAGAFFSSAACDSPRPLPLPLLPSRLLLLLAELSTDDIQLLVSESVELSAGPIARMVAPPTRRFMFFLAAAAGLRNLPITPPVSSCTFCTDKHTFCTRESLSTDTLSARARSAQTDTLCARARRSTQTNTQQHEQASAGGSS